jgi:hypothetical protein
MNFEQKIRYILLTILISLGLCTVQSAHGKARFMGLEELVAVCDFIGVIEIIRTEKVGEKFQDDLPRKGHWKYSQKNSFNILYSIKTSAATKTDPAALQVLWAEKTFICASASYKPGRYLVFLKSVDLNEWITINHQLGALLIENNIVDFNYYLTQKDTSPKISIETAEEKIKKYLKGR